MNGSNSYRAKVAKDLRDVAKNLKTHSPLWAQICRRAAKELTRKCTRGCT
jgi:hypothetical protein